jgi:hypothetical protein
MAFLALPGRPLPGVLEDGPANGTGASAGAAPVPPPNPPPIPMVVRTPSGLPPVAALVPLDSRVKIDRAIYDQASAVRDRMFPAERPTVHSTVENGRRRVRRALSSTTALMLVNQNSRLPTPEEDEQDERDWKARKERRRRAAVGAVPGDDEDEEEEEAEEADDGEGGRRVVLRLVAPPEGTWRPGVPAASAPPLPDMGEVMQWMSWAGWSDAERAWRWRKAGNPSVHL